MRAAFGASERRASLLAALVLSLLLSGCATPKIDWASRVGNYTFDQAVLELGPPDKSAPLKDGTVVADWVTQSGYSRTYPVSGYSGYPYGYGYPYRYPAPFGMAYYDTLPDYILRLTFGPDGRLQSWKNVTR